jgi:hypothetical protein
MKTAVVWRRSTGQVIIAIWKLAALLTKSSPSRLLSSTAHEPTATRLLVAVLIPLIGLRICSHLYCISLCRGPIDDVATCFKRSRYDAALDFFPLRFLVVRRARFLAVRAGSTFCAGGGDVSRWILS